MPDYRLYHFKYGHIYYAEDLTAADDVDAVHRADKLANGEPAELWQEKRRIKVFMAP
jgi:hypothetical protein